MRPEDQSDCMHSVDAVVIHGANGVCEVPLADGWHPSTLAVLLLALSAVVVALTALCIPQLRRLGRLTKSEVDEERDLPG